MEFVVCEKGHAYDKSEGECPMCAAARNNAQNEGNAASLEDYEKTKPDPKIVAQYGYMTGNRKAAESSVRTPKFDKWGGSMEAIAPTAGVDQMTDGVLHDVAPTQKEDSLAKPNTPIASYVPTGSKIDQVEEYTETQLAVSYEGQTVGWLVCVKGPCKGQDYHLHAGNNHMGRSPKNDVFLQGDAAISAEDGILGFDSRSGSFYFAGGMGKNMSYVNNQVVYNFVELHAYDVITIGNTDLMFVPLCGEHFTWKQ